MQHKVKWHFLSGLILALLWGVALGATPTQEARTVASFTAVRLLGAIDLVISQGSSESVNIEGEADQVKDVTTTVQNGTLVISHKTGWSLWSWFRVPSAAPRAVVSAKTLNAIELEGSGDIHGATLVSQEKFLARVTGTGDIHIDALAARALDVRIAGSGDVRIAGAVNDADVRIAGSGNFSGGELKVGNCKVVISGSGDATVWARDRLDVSIAGSGDVGYYGTPVVAQALAGSGSIKPLGAKN